MRSVTGTHASGGRHRTPSCPIYRGGCREVPRATPVGGVDQGTHREARQPGENPLFRFALEVMDSTEGTVVFACNFCFGLN